MWGCGSGKNTFLNVICQKQTMKRSSARPKGRTTTDSDLTAVHLQQQCMSCVRTYVRTFAFAFAFAFLFSCFGLMGNFFHFFSFFSFFFVTIELIEQGFMFVAYLCVPALVLFCFA